MTLPRNGSALPSIRTARHGTRNTHPCQDKLSSRKKDPGCPQLLYGPTLQAARMYSTCIPQSHTYITCTISKNSNPQSLRRRTRTSCAVPSSSSFPESEVPSVKSFRRQANHGLRAKIACETRRLELESDSFLTRAREALKKISPTSQYSLSIVKSPLDRQHGSAPTEPITSRPCTTLQATLGTSGELIGQQ